MWITYFIEVLLDVFILNLYRSIITCQFSRIYYLSIPCDYNKKKVLSQFTQFLLRKLESTKLLIKTFKPLKFIPKSNFYHFVLKKWQFLERLRIN